MCRFNPDNYLKPLPKKMCEFLKEYTSIEDRNNVSEQTGISYHTLYKVTLGIGKLTKTNERAIKALMNQAVENCGNVEARAKSDIKTFEKLMQEEMMLP